MPEQKLDRKARFRGALLGVAIGDAAGAPFEFCERGSFEPATDFHGNGHWTDDTSMTLALALSLIERPGFDIAHQVELYISWMHREDDRLGDTVSHIGLTIQRALKLYLRTGDPYSGPSDEWSAGIGSLLRVSPVPLFFCSSLDQAVQFSRESSRTTHQESRCLDSCAYMAALMWGAVNGHSKEELLNAHFPSQEFWAPRQVHPEVQSVMAGDFKDVLEPDSTGFVIHSLRAALWAFHHSDSFRDGALLAINLGGDADTTGAIYGGLAGAFYGVDQIPSEWRKKVHDGALIVEVADRLLAASVSGRGQS